MKEPVTRSLQGFFNNLKCIAPKLQFVDRPVPQLPGAKLRRIINEGKEDNV